MRLLRSFHQEQKFVAIIAQLIPSAFLSFLSKSTWVYLFRWVSLVPKFHLGTR